MKKFSPIFFLALFFFQTQSWACDENRARLAEKRGLGPEGGYQLLVCSDGVYGEPQKSQLLNFFNRMPEDTVNKWAFTMTEGAAENKKELMDLIAKQPTNDIAFTNIKSNDKVSPAQTKVLNRVLKDWNSKMDIKPQKKVDLFNPEAFNKYGEKNKKLLETLAASGRQCNMRASRDKKLAGFKFKFTDDEPMTILPISMEKESENTYVLKYRQLRSFSTLLPESTRRIKVDPKTKRMTWLGSSDGNKYYIDPQKSSKKSMKSMFNMTLGMNSGARTHLCNAESALEKAEKGKKSQKTAN